MQLLYKFIALLLPAFTGAVCYPPGAVFPIPKLSIFAESDPSLSARLHDSLQSTLSKLPYNTTSFSVAITSEDDIIWESHYTAKILGNYADSSPTNVTGDTAFRIASITKVFAVLAVMLTEGMELEDSIVKYVPELLREGGGGVRWNDVTLEALGSHTAGLVRECEYCFNCKADNCN
jgi:CubicO group peptidase (beta-lactamase class C family)